MVELGLDEFFIYKIGYRNLYAAKCVIEGYNFGRGLSKIEKRTLMQAVLDCSVLREESNTLLARLIERLQQYGFKKQDVYGLIINLGIYNENGNSNLIGYSYPKLLRNSKEENQKIKQCKEQSIDIATVSHISIIIALSKYLKEDEGTKLIERLQDELGINGEFLRGKSIENVFIATQIVDGYEFGRHLENEKKSALIQLILRSVLFNKGKKQKIATFLRKFEQLGFDQQQTYGLMINLFVNGLKVDGVEHTYPDFFGNNVLWKRLKEQQGYMPTNVSDITIKKAQKEVEKSHQNAQQTMRNATKNMARDGIGGVRRELGGLNLTSTGNNTNLENVIE